MSDRVTHAYDAGIVIAYLKSLTSKDGKYLNGECMTISHKEMLARWAKWDTVSLFKVDAFLTRYFLMTWELEMWAEEHYGWNGFVQTGLPTVLS